MSKILHGYEFNLWQPVYFNDKFHHNTMEREVIDAENEAEARAIMELRLKPASEPYKISDNLTIHAEKQYIKSVYWLGKLVYMTVKKYERD